MKNKKGFLLAEETLKIVIAVICMGFLVYFLTALYMSNKDSKDLELAKASLQHLVDEINAGRTEVEIYNPSPSSFSTQVKFIGWKISSWSSVSEMPNQCSNLGWNNCICFCKEDFLDDEREECDKTGVCLGYLRNIKFGETNIINIDTIPLTLSIKYNENGIIITKK
jgi:hypothetical protein